MASQVSSRGQITIDREAREQLGVRPGMVAYQRVASGHLEIVFLPAPHRRSLYGTLRRGQESARVITADDLEEAVMEAVSEEQRQSECSDG